MCPEQHFVLLGFSGHAIWLNGATAPAAGRGLLSSPPSMLAQVTLVVPTQSGTTCLSRPLLKAQVPLSQGLLACLSENFVHGVPLPVLGGLSLRGRVHAVQHGEQQKLDLSCFAA